MAELRSVFENVGFADVSQVVAPAIEQNILSISAVVEAMG
jgi:uncharacterized protein (DUF1697 family)